MKSLKRPSDDERQPETENDVGKTGDRAKPYRDSHFRRLGQFLLYKHSF